MYRSVDQTNQASYSMNKPRMIAEALESATVVAGYADPSLGRLSPVHPSTNITGDQPDRNIQSRWLWIHRITAGIRQNWDILPFVGMHAMCLWAIQTGIDAGMVLLAIASYYLRMFAVTAGYHRYFSHRSYKTSRLFQFLMAFLAMTSAQKGVLWWAAHHRHHHRHSDTPHDIHSPVQQGFWSSHVGWMLTKASADTDFSLVQDLCRYPELRFLNRFHYLPPTVYALVLFALWGFPGLVWGFFVSTTVLYHCTFFINSLTHLVGRVRYRSNDGSKNSFLLALLCCGEGWHNNHHYYQSAVNQGWFWWEVDLSYYVLRGLALFGIVWDLRLPPPHIKAATIAATAGSKPRTSL